MKYDEVARTSLDNSCLVGEYWNIFLFWLLQFFQVIAMCCTKFRINIEIIQQNCSERSWLRIVEPIFIFSLLVIPISYLYWPYSQKNIARDDECYFLTKRNVNCFVLTTKLVHIQNQAFLRRRIYDARTGCYPEINDADFKYALSNNI